ncbi:hypothetical protein NLG97_g2728 [Lecanicillium saksenae]|uniref:Uncharacterized protein n=1 Tax=Lecanicillium saksenae TaxID=468837 RepID=A0ACC1R059_9HYPO|nr:hypothetical protein NLG97_g2728 [Lecanicillium saksenae]
MPPSRPSEGQKTALVTGAGVGGIGGELALQLHNAGYFVICAVRRPESISILLKPGLISIFVDVTDTESIVAAAVTVSDICGNRLDLLINNAGLAINRPALDQDIDVDTRRMLDVNVLGPMRVTKAFAKLLIEARGCVVNIGSVAPIAPLLYSAAYNASKAALHAYSEALYLEMKPFGVHVITVITGGVKSNLVREEKPDLPADSLYTSVQEAFHKRLVSGQDQGMDTETYARHVVGMIQKKTKPRTFWSGGGAFPVWFLYNCLPTGLRLAVMAQRHGLAQLVPRTPLQ